MQVEAQSSRWGGYEWSPWYSWANEVAAHLYGIRVPHGTVDRGPGVYRYRSSIDGSQLLYIGIAHSRFWGTSLARFAHEYTSALRANGEWPNRRPRPDGRMRPFWGFPTCLVNHAMSGDDIELSYSLLPGISKPGLLETEARLMQLHKREVGKYPHCHWRQNGIPKPQPPPLGSFGLENYVLRGRTPGVTPKVWGT